MVECKVNLSASAAIGENTCKTRFYFNPRLAQRCGGRMGYHTSFRELCLIRLSLLTSQALSQINHVQIPSLKYSKIQAIPIGMLP